MRSENIRIGSPVEGEYEVLFNVSPVGAKFFVGLVMKMISLLKTIKENLFQAAQIGSKRRFQDPTIKWTHDSLNPAADEYLWFIVQSIIVLYDFPIL